MASKNNTTSMPVADFVPVPTEGKEAPTKRSPTSDIRFTVLKPSDQEPMDFLVAVPSNTPITDAINTPVDPTEAFKTIFSDITEYLLFRIAPLSCETKTVLLQL